MNAITNNVINSNKEYYIQFFDTEIRETIHNTLVNTDFEEDDDIYVMHIDLTILNLTFEFAIFGAKLAYKNRYSFDGEIVGKYKKECDHDYEFKSITINNVWCSIEEEYIKLDILEELNNKMIDLWKM